MSICAINEPLTNLVRESPNLQKIATFKKYFYEVKWNRDFVGLVYLLLREFQVPRSLLYCMDFEENLDLKGKY
jgi:hypothetical protein